MRRFDDVVKILLLHTNESYAETLAHYVSTEYPSYDVDVVSRVPVPERLRAILARASTTSFKRTS